MTAVLDQNVKKPSLSLREMPPDKMKPFFNSTVTRLIQSVNLSLLSVFESYRLKQRRDGGQRNKATG